VRGVGVADLATVAETAATLACPMHVHVSEQVGENEVTVAEHGITPTALLAREGLLTNHTTLIHATHLTPDDREIIATSGSMVCFCPTTESDLGDGIGPALELHEAGVPLCLGSDSNATIDILREAHRVEQHDRLRLMRAATETGMRSLGWDDRGLAVGAPADFISIDPNGSELRDTEPSLGAIVSSATRASVRTVVVAGVERDRG
jgi:cytosine/adenosine deaminase-related metal-dependent hydrolase